jgi:hypothetical protein
LRTDAHAHRLLHADSELAQSVAVLSRATQDAIWRRSRATQERGPCCASTTAGSSPRSRRAANGNYVAD